ncbi:hypothetical protein CROQUDRAFT_666154 [Cronartium quercuum f. sp. fusiforme G11]|uniref:JmjC domain-containing protein n=1 Tax=Cronartium quercuum f. sp. fusiforme G11 TaxID=708437 RepID=A0A9P6T5L6_9BASI|nr:hypothetical protein CROQUDRAFT_666154 [Cronartium quercuum f. sp. fusiforme G11]
MDTPLEGNSEVSHTLPWSHNPRRIQPLGNLWLSDDPKAIYYRERSFGTLSKIPDELLLLIFTELEPKDLHLAQGVSRYFFGWCVGLDGIWKVAYLSQRNKLVDWKGTWRSTYFGRNQKLETDRIELSNVYSDILFQPYLAAGFSISKMIGLDRFTFLDRIKRMKGSDEVGLEKFGYDRPLILNDLMKDWKAMNWSLDLLSFRFPKVEFRAESSLVTILDYQNYYDDCLTEESPLYLFDAEFVEKTSKVERLGGLGLDYCVPKLFQCDLFSCLGSKRPDFRWLIIGPARSGSTWHKDPNGTSAWNAVITGRKLWICFPPDLTPPGVWVSEDESEVESPLSIAEWFLNYYQIAKEEYGPRAKDPLKKGQMVEGICEAGEIFYVPSGWWHLVVNLEGSIAITQNFVSEFELVDVLRFMKYRPDQLSGFRNIEKQEVLKEFLNALRQSNQISIEKLNESIKKMEENKREEQDFNLQIKKRRRRTMNHKSESIWEKLLNKTKKPRKLENGQEIDEKKVNDSLDGLFTFGFLVEDDSESLW